MSGIDYEVVEVTHDEGWCAPCRRAIRNAAGMLATGTVEATATGWSPLDSEFGGGRHRAVVRRAKP